MAALPGAGSSGGEHGVGGVACEAAAAAAPVLFRQHREWPFQENCIMHVSFNLSGGGMLLAPPAPTCPGPEEPRECILERCVGFVFLCKQKIRYFLQAQICCVWLQDKGGQQGRALVF